MLVFIMIIIENAKRNYDYNHNFDRTIYLFINYKSSIYVSSVFIASCEHAGQRPNAT